MQDSIYSSLPVERIIEMIVLQDHTEIFLRAHRLQNGLIPDLSGKTYVVEVYRDNMEKKMPQHQQFEGKSPYVWVPKTVVHHDLLTGAILFEDGTKSNDSKDEIANGAGRQRTPIITRPGWYQAPNTGEWTNEPPAAEESRQTKIATSFIDELHKQFVPSEETT